MKYITSVLGYSFINSDPENMTPLHQKRIKQRIHDIALQEQDYLALNILQTHLQNSNTCTVCR